MTPLSVRLAELADADPTRPALTCGAESLNRREIDRRSTALAHAYAALGVQPGSLVTIGLPNGIEFVLAAVAAWKLGATPQPVSYRLPEAELAAVLGLADPALVVGLAAPGRTAVPAGYVPPEDHSPLPDVVPGPWKAPTSGGSTGRPKIILSGQPAVAEVLDGLAASLGMTPGGVHLVAGPMYHNAPFMMSAAALFSGNHVVVLPKFDAAELLRAVAAYGVDWMFLVPTMMHRIWRLPAAQQAEVASLRVVLHGAAPCPAWLKRAWIGWLGGERLVELYASAEAQAACLISGTEWLAHPGSVGRVRLGEVRILDEHHQDVPAGELGEVWMRPSPGTPPTYEYLGDTATTLPGGWQSPGDIGRFDEDGYLHLADRKPDTILLGGANVYPAEVEAALDEHPSVLSSCVIGLPDDEYGNVVHAIVQTDGPLDESALLTHLKDRLVTYKLPRSFEYVDKPLRDDAGKVRRGHLRAERLAEQPTGRR